MLEIRSARPDEMAEFRRLVSMNLLVEPASLETLSPDWTLCAFEDGRLATTYASWPLTLRLDGAAVPVAGVTCVSTNPVYRRRGNLRRIMETDFSRLYEEKRQPFAILFASMAAIYQRFGYGIVSGQVSYAVEPRYLQFAHPAPVTGKLREVSKDDEFGLLVDLYRRFRAERTGYIHRGRAMWEAGTLGKAPPGHTRVVLVYEEDDGPQGFVSYTVGPGHHEGPGPAQALAITDLVWLTTTAYRAFWEHFSRMDLVREVAWAKAPPDDPLPQLVLEPRMLRPRWSDGLLARIIDVPAALSSRPYPVESVLRFEVRDEMCPWNTGCYEMQTGAEAEVRQVGTASSAAGSPVLTSEPELTVDVNTLAMLVFGQLSASEAARMGRAQVHDPRSLARWDAALKTKYRPFCPDFF